MRGHHAAVLHHGGADGPQVLVELLGIWRAQALDVGQDPLVRLQRGTDGALLGWRSDNRASQNSIWESEMQARSFGGKNQPRRQRGGEGTVLWKMGFL